MVFLVLILTLASAVLIIFAWIERRYSTWKNKGVPYEEPHFPYGSFKGIKANAYEGQTLEKFYKKFKGQAPFAGIYFALEPIALILDTELVRQILISDFSAFQDRGFFSNPTHEPISGQLAALSAPKWKPVRTMLSPGFTVSKMKSMLPVCLTVASKLDSKLNEISQSGTEFDVKRLATCYTMDISGCCFLSLDCNCLKDEDSELFRIMTGIFNNPLDGTASLLLKFALRHHAETLRLKTFRKEVSVFFTRLVREAVKFRQANNIHKQDLLESLISAHENDDERQISFNEILAQSFNFFIGGFETSASTIQFCLYELAKNPEIQREARKHLFEVLNKHQQELTWEALSDMKYIEQMIFETLRMYPVLGTITREAVSDYKVPSMNATLEKGTLIMIPVYAIHHDPQFYPNSLTFDPDRFSEANMKALPPGSFLGFGAGPRNCIGRQLGMLQVKIAIVTALKKYEFSLAKKSMQPLKLETRTFLVTGAAEKIYLHVCKIEN